LLPWLASRSRTFRLLFCHRWIEGIRQTLHDAKPRPKTSCVCELGFESSECKAVFAISKSQQIPDTPPRFNELIRMPANPGDYSMMAKTQPWTQTLWIGLQSLYFPASVQETSGRES
jgi:hypothetical protein